MNLTDVQRTMVEGELAVCQHVVDGEQRQGNGRGIRMMIPAVKQRNVYRVTLDDELIFPLLGRTSDRGQVGVIECSKDDTRPEYGCGVG